MTLQELARHDGSNGRQALVAVNGKIYDVTASPFWSGGDHMGEHQAGRDLTEELKSAPHVRSVIERFPLVDQLTGAEEASGIGMRVVIAAVILALVALGLFLFL